MNALPDRPGAWHRRVWALSWPSILANLTVPLVGLVDTAMMGQLPDARYIGAVAIGATTFSAVYWLFGFFRMGTTGLLSQRYGAGALAEGTLIALRTALLALALGVLLIILHPLLKGLLPTLFGAKPDTLTLAGDYLTVRIWGAPAMLLQYVALGVLFALQRMRAALLVALLVNATNIALDLLFVLALELRVEGVALATALSEWLGALVGAGFALRALEHAAKQAGVRIWAFRLHELWAPGALRELFSVAANLIVRSFFVQLPFFLFTALGSRFGETTLAANAVLMQYYMAVAYGLDGFAHCAETLAGYAFGARNRQALRQVVRYSTGWALVLAAFLSGAYGLAAEPMIALITSQPPVQAEALRYAGWVIAAPLVCVWPFLMDGVYIGTTQLARLRNHMALAAAVFGLACFTLIPALGNHGLWLALTLFMFSRGVTLLLAYPQVEAAAVAYSPAPTIAPAKELPHE